MMQWYKHFILGRMSSPRQTNQPFEGPDVSFVAPWLNCFPRHGFPVTSWGSNHHCHVTRHTVLCVWNRGYQTPFGRDKLERIVIDVAPMFSLWSYIAGSYVIIESDTYAIWWVSKRWVKPDMLKLYRTHAKQFPRATHPPFATYSTMSWYFGRCFRNSGSPGQCRHSQWFQHLRWIPETIHHQLQSLHWIQVSVFGVPKKDPERCEPEKWNGINSNDDTLNGRFIHQHTGHSHLASPHTWSPSHWIKHNNKHCNMM